MSNDAVTAQILAMQGEQTKILLDVSATVARLDEKLTAHGDLDKRVTDLEHDRTRVQTVMWVIGLGIAALTTAVGWLLGK